MIVDTRGSYYASIHQLGDLVTKIKEYSGDMLIYFGAVILMVNYPLPKSTVK